MQRLLQSRQDSIQHPAGSHYHEALTACAKGIGDIERILARVALRPRGP